MEDKDTTRELDNPQEEKKTKSRTVWEELKLMGPKRSNSNGIKDSFYEHLCEFGIFFILLLNRIL